MRMVDYFTQGPGAPDFAAIRARLALAFVEHKADIGAAAARNEDIVVNVDRICAVLMAAFLTACIDGRREAFVEPFGWFVEIVAEVFDGAPCKLDS